MKKQGIMHGTKQKMFQDKRKLSASSALLGGIFTAIWGIGHLVVTEVVVSDFKVLPMPIELVKTIRLEWVGEGITLISLGVLIMLLYHDLRKGNRVAWKISIVISCILFTFAIWHTLGSPLNRIEYQLCAPIFTLSALLIILPLLIYRDKFKEGKEGSLEEARKTISERKEQRKQIILKEIEKKRRITNNEVEKLLGVSDATATRYLDELEAKGKIKQIGVKKGAYYTLK